MKKVKLGFYAVKFGPVALCHGASLVVTHDKSTLRELAPVNKDHVYQTVVLENAVVKAISFVAYSCGTFSFARLSLLNRTHPFKSQIIEV
ncbi:hypothetical protein LCE44_27415 [Vibrio harveyi]|uniref:hypothetical protein n=1 Tax=Vibrio TaxID=662 RepID=UPI00036CEF64|nr:MULTISPECIES: hypothetical protein [Vibrio]EJG1646022.1 hypothetical protein [Vibrio parahaemolyticus]KNY40980.1 hypothetical protein AKG94_20175 [Vibrio harveyi]MDA0126279.1 hypothetical protein [Vibrio sp. MM46]HDM8057102.1 hypothetical protein [Vibrio harveyi]